MGVQGNRIKQHPPKAFYQWWLLLKIGYCLVFPHPTPSTFWPAKKVCSSTTIKLVPGAQTLLPCCSLPCLLAALQRQEVPACQVLWDLQWGSPGLARPKHCSSRPSGVPSVRGTSSYLQHGEAGLPGEAELLLLRGVGIEAVLVQPVPEDLHGLLGKIAPSLPLVGLRGVRGCGAVVLPEVAIRHGGAARRSLLVKAWQGGNQRTGIRLRPGQGSEVGGSAATAPPPPRTWGAALPLLAWPGVGGNKPEVAPPPPPRPGRGEATGTGGDNSPPRGSAEAPPA